MVRSRVDIRGQLQFAEPFVWLAGGKGDLPQPGPGGDLLRVRAFRRRLVEGRRPPNVAIGQVGLARQQLQAGVGRHAAFDQRLDGVLGARRLPHAQIGLHQQLPRADMVRRPRHRLAQGGLGSDELLDLILDRSREHERRDVIRQVLQNLLNLLACLVEVTLAEGE